MASILKRKRGPAEAADSQKRSKSVKGAKLAEALAANQPSAWDAAFPTPNVHDLIENGVNGGDAVEALDFETINDAQLHATEELTQKRVQQHEDAQRALKKAIRRREQQSWKLSEAIGGRMISVDPVFTSGEKFLIVANRTAVHVYSTSNSLLHRSIKLKLEVSARIITYYLSPTYENILWVAASDGSIFSLDWTTGAGSEQYWGISSTGCTHMTVASMESAGRRRDVVFTSEPRKGGGWRITANELAPPNGLIKTAARTIYTSSHRINFLSSVCQGSVIVASADNSVLVGNLRAVDFDTVDKMRYEFRVFESAEPITCLDVKGTERTDPREYKKAVSKLPVVNVAVGGAKGAIFYHTDLLAKLVMSQSGTFPAGVSLLPKKLHWHRKAVHTVKFSLDGNYIISGGSETVLLLWQMDTGRQSYLPHMTATIENVVVSPQGSSYAIKLADNSVVVLSTAELEPTVSISGIQANVVKNEPSIFDSVSRVEGEKWGRNVVQRTPAVINPLDPTKLLLGVGSVQEADSVHSLVMSNPFLQTYDIGSGVSVSKQGLARNNVTNINITPNANPLTEPRVTHIKISSDGRWLATVDEWTTPEMDLEFLASKSHTAKSEQLVRREVFLKFWLWGEESNSWELVSRVDSPHSLVGTTGVAGRILDLAIDPSSSRFATIGEDDTVRTWVPRTRRRDGVVVKGKGGVAYNNWVCEHEISLGKPELSDEVNEFVGSAAVAFSEDGSLLAAASDNEDGLVSLLDSESGTIHLSQTRLFDGHISKMEFLGQDLIILSDNLNVYDFVAGELKSSIALTLDVTPNVSQKREMFNLAVDLQSRTYAVAIPRFQKINEEELSSAGDMPRERFTYTELVIFSQDKPEPQMAEQIPSFITAVLPSRNSEGYVVLDSSAEIRVVLRRGTQAVTALAQSVSAQQLDSISDEPVANILVAAEEELEEPEAEVIYLPTPAESQQEAADDDDETKVVTQQQLAQVFDVGPSYALPSVEDLFYQVAGLFSAKPSGQAV